MNPRAALLLITVVLAAVSAAMLTQRRNLRAELVALADARDTAVIGAANARLAAEVDRIRLALEQARALPARNADAHLALSIGDGHLTLERGTIILRSTTVAADVPRGIHPIDSISDRAIVLAGAIRLVRDPGDTTVAPPGTIRIPRVDFDAIRPNVKTGFMAYFF
jgi:hypothetical protein